MVYFFAGITIVLLIGALRDEFRPGGSLFPAFDEARAERDETLAELLEFAIHDGWERDDVVRTYAEIQAL